MNDIKLIKSEKKMSLEHNICLLKYINFEHIKPHTNVSSFINYDHSFLPPSLQVRAFMTSPKMLHTQGR